MNKLDKQYTELLQNILDKGVEKEDRTGTGTKSIFGYTIRHDMKDGFPLLTTKKMPFKTIVTELIWFLRGDTNIKFLVDNGCNIWNGDAYKNYLKSGDDCQVRWLFNKAGHEPCPIDGPFYRHYSLDEFINKIKTDDEFAKIWGELGPIYGKQWRDWEGVRAGMSISGDMEWGDLKDKYGIDQLNNLVNEIKSNPDSRRLIVNAWNVEDLGEMVLPPCHYGFQIYTRKLTTEEQYAPYQDLLDIFKEKIEHIKTQNYEKAAGCRLKEKEILNKIPDLPERAISLIWNQRSVDTFLGLPFNIASYGILLTVLAELTNMVPDQLIGNLGDTHLYLNHIEQAEEQINREPYELSEIKINSSNWLKESNDFNALIESINIDDFSVENYQSHITIKAPLSN